MRPKSVISILATLLSLGLLVPGLYLPVISINMDATIDAQVSQFQVELVNQQRSILGAIHELYAKEYVLVALLIFVFSVLVPFVKALLSLISQLSRNEQRSRQIDRILHAIARWSMADVFVVAIFIVILSTSSEGRRISQTLSFFGMQIPLEVQITLKAIPLQGFYFFLSYCLVSLAALSIHARQKPAG